MERKISLVETILMVMIVGSYEVFEFFAGLAAGIPVLGQILMIVNMLGDWVIWLIIQFWLIMKGVKNLSYTGGSLIEMVPWLDMLPLRTLGLLTTIYFANKAAQPAAAEAPPTTTQGEQEEAPEAA